MKNRFVIIITVLLIFSSIFLLGSFIKRNFSTKSINSEQRISLGNIESYLKEADAFEEKGSLLEAKEIYQRLLNMSLPAEQMIVVQQRMENLNIRILLSGINIPQSQIYEVQPGDSLSKIAKKFNVTVETIAKANNIQGNVIRTGMKLRILKGKFNILVDKSQNNLILKFNDEVAKTYNVSTGKNNSTPVGTYKIVNKLINPVWYKDGKAIPPTSPENILGSRWMGFDLPEYGIHGTTKPEEIGKQITEGCVRMVNNDVEELYSLVPEGTEVTIVD